MAASRWLQRRLINRFIHDEDGNSALLIAPMLVAIFGMAALAYDGIHGYTKKEQLRTSAEVAALAAVHELDDLTAATQLALNFAALNKPAMATGDVVTGSEVEFGNWANQAFLANAVPLNAVRVTASLTQSKSNPVATLFGEVIGNPTLDISISAIALAGEGSSPCVLALSPNDNKAIEINSNATINTPDCALHVNSNDNEGLYTDSNADVNTSANCVVGDYGEYSNSDISPMPDTGCPAATDPLASLADPTYGGCDYNGLELDNANTTLSPGVYCDGLTIKGNSNVQFDPGIYIIKDKEFFVDSNSIVSGTEVGFFLTGSDDAALKFDSNSQISFTAPTSGEMQGVLFYGDRDYEAHHVFDSNVAAVVDGAFYFPNGRFESNSNSTMAGSSSCFMLIADTIYFDSNAGIDMSGDLSNCPVNSMISAGGGTPTIVFSG